MNNEDPVVTMEVTQMQLMTMRRVLGQVKVSECKSDEEAVDILLALRAIKKAEEYFKAAPPTRRDS